MKSYSDEDRLTALASYQMGKTTREIAFEYGFSKSWVAKQVLLAGLSRTRSIRQHVLLARGKACEPLHDSFLDYFDGLMISDGHLSKPSKSRTSHYLQSCKHKEWLDVVAANFRSNGIRAVVNEDVREGIRVGWYLRTDSYDQLGKQYSRWYSRTKGVPRDIRFSADMLKNWVYGDGTLSRSNLRLCCDSFTKK